MDFSYVPPDPTERRLLHEAVEFADANEVALPPVDELDALAAAVLLPPPVLVAAIAVALAAAYYI